MPGEVVRWPVAGVTGETIGRARRGMVEMNIFPGAGGMAGSAIARVMTGRLDIVMAGLALVWRASKLALCVAGFTLQPGVLACQREKGMFCTGAAGQE